MSTVADWLDTREPAPPLALGNRVRKVLGKDVHRDAREVSEACLAAGERLLADILCDEHGNRDCALDLLTADALVTYAFEAASSEPDVLAARATRAMTRIAALGTPPSFA